jgi:hypothetical protein
MASGPIPSPGSRKSERVVIDVNLLSFRTIVWRVLKLGTVAFQGASQVLFSDIFIRAIGRWTAPGSKPSQSSDDRA